MKIKVEYSVGFTLTDFKEKCNQKDIKIDEVETIDNESFTLEIELDDNNNIEPVMMVIDELISKQFKNFNYSVYFDDSLEYIISDELFLIITKQNDIIYIKSNQSTKSIIKYIDRNHK